ncbi:sigma 54 modulation/S30EA ribosomal C-terminal domain-containing protein [Mycobacterium sp.]|uniref:sigma 54 modulation/S30EA ribosomal C-terminal domain-containing protein n=1 Tax=Mycobacterium sp. TaxID=1785 RepID=UPI003C743FD0
MAPPTLADRTRRALIAPAEAVITRRKPVVLQRATPLEAVAVMDAMDYDVHLFTDAETGEDAVVYRAGPSGLRLARQRRMYPPGWSWSPPTGGPPVRLIVNSLPTPTLTETVALDRLRQHGLRFLFFTDPGTDRGQLLYPRYDGYLGLITPIDGAPENGAT